MKTNGLGRCVAVMLVLGGVAVIGGCGSKLSGKYSGTKEGMTVSIDFKSSDKADMAMGSATREVGYEKDGSKITVHPPAGKSGADMVLMVESDGSLSCAEGDFKGVKFVKQ